MLHIVKMRLFQWVTGIKRSLWVGISVSLVLGIYEGTQEVPQWQLGDGSPSLWSRAVTSKLSLVWVLRTSLLTIIISWKNYATRLANYATMFRIILAYCVNQIVGHALSHGVTDSKWTHVGRLLYSGTCLHWTHVYMENEKVFNVRRCSMYPGSE